MKFQFCPTNSGPNYAKVACECIAGFEKKSGNEKCTPCDLNYYKNGQGDNTCTVCPDSKVTSSDGSTNEGDCISDQFEQTVTLFNGINYFSFWVDLTDKKIVDILNLIDIKFASVSVFNTRGDTDFIMNTEDSGKFAGRVDMHKVDNVYLLNIQTEKNEVYLKITGKVLQKVVDIGIIVGINWLPVIYNTERNSVAVMPIQRECPSDTTCSAFKYTEYDQYTRMYMKQGVLQSGIAQIEDTDDIGVEWDYEYSFKRGQTYKLAVVNGEGRISGKSGRMPVQLNNLTVANTFRSNSYSTQVSRRRRLLSLATTTTVDDPTFCHTKRKSSNNDASSCECMIPNQLTTTITDSIPWPRDECNKCVMADHNDVCNNVGSDLQPTGMTFSIRVSPPVGHTLSEESTGVAKLKRTFGHTEAVPGLQYEHLSIRAFDHPYITVVKTMVLWIGTILLVEMTPQFLFFS